MTADRTYINKEIIDRVSNGDEAAFRVIYDQYRDKIYSYAFHLTESSVLADEVIQEVF